MAPDAGQARHIMSQASSAPRRIPVVVRWLPAGGGPARPVSGQSMQPAPVDTVQPPPVGTLLPLSHAPPRASLQVASLDAAPPPNAPPTSNPHSGKPPSRSPAPRDFVPWRFLDAGRPSVRRGLIPPASKNLHTTDSRWGNSASSFPRPSFHSATAPATPQAPLSAGRGQAQPNLESVPLKTSR